MESSFLFAACLVGLSLLVTSSYGYSPHPTKKKPKLLVVLLDGMRWDHFGLDLQHLSKVKESGVKAKWLDPVFVTMSLPSMMSIATGLYPESHNIVHNLYFDPVTKARSTSYEETLNNTEWFATGAEPIWVTAMKNDLKVSSIFYPGTYVPIMGYKPEIAVPISRWHYFNYPKEKRIDDTISWLSEDGVDLSMLYFADPDVGLHLFGMENINTTYLTLALDHYMGYLFKGIEEAGLRESLNVIIVSDHGHMEVNSSKTIELYDYINETDVEFIIGDYGPTFQLLPKEGKFEKIYNTLRDAHPHLHVFKKEELPERFHFGKASRVLPIFGYVDPTWAVFTRYNVNVASRSDHGYDNEEQDMKGIFYGTGPFFKQGYETDAVNSIDLYEMMCEILELKAAPNNGSRSSYADIKNPQATSSRYGVTIVDCPPCGCGASRTLFNFALLSSVLIFYSFQKWSSVS